MDNEVICYFRFGFKFIYILLTSDFSEISRYGEELGNVNAVGLIVGIACIFCFYFILEENKHLFIIFLIPMFIVILLTGSRKSIFFVIFSIIFILRSRMRKNLSSKLKPLIFILAITVIVFYLVFNVPFFYYIIGSRLEKLFLFARGYDVLDNSISERSYMATVGIKLILERPITGYGIDNFRHLFITFPGGRNTYSHNNFIEIMVGTGIFGVITYYLTHIIIIKDLYNISKIQQFRTLSFTFISIIISYLILSIGLVYYYNKHFGLLLAISSVISRIIKKGTYN